jgi:hypothetical protein
MSGIFGGAPKMPEPPPEPPKVDTEAVQMASEAERRRQRMARGRASTMLGGGTSTEDTMIGTSKLLGR